MHKGWWIAFWVIVVQLALGAAVYHFMHNDTATEPPSTDVKEEPGMDIGELLTGSELMLIPAMSLSALPESALDAAVCARICAVPGEGDGALAGTCSAPVTIAGSIDGEDGKQLVVAVPDGSSPEAYAYFAAGERRLLLVPADRCGAPPPGELQPVVTEDEPGELP